MTISNGDHHRINQSTKLLQAVSNYLPLPPCFSDINLLSGEHSILLILILLSGALWLQVGLGCSVHVFFLGAM